MPASTHPTVYGLVTTRVLKEASLPYRLFAAFSTTFRQLFVGRHDSLVAARKVRFDLTPARGVVRVSARQFPYRVQMVGQQNDGNDFKRPSRSHAPECIS